MRFNCTVLSRARPGHHARMCKVHIRMHTQKRHFNCMKLCMHPCWQFVRLLGNKPRSCWFWVGWLFSCTSICTYVCNQVNALISIFFLHFTVSLIILRIDYISTSCRIIMAGLNIQTHHLRFFSDCHSIPPVWAVCLFFYLSFFVQSACSQCVCNFFSITSFAWLQFFFLRCAFNWLCCVDDDDDGADKL